MTINPAWLGAGGVCAAGGVLACGALAPGSQLFGRTLRRLKDTSCMAITFDDGPNPVVTRGILELLERYNATATFFLIGQRVRAFPAVAREIAERGHAIGNHTETHPSLTFLSAGRIADELDRCEDAIVEATEKSPRWMRPPYGYRSPLLDGIVRRRGGAGVAMWNVAAKDWRTHAPEPVIQRLRKARGGDIVLLHDGDHRVLEGKRGHVVKALKYWLPRWRDAGIQFVNLDEAQLKTQAG
ncbi:MAG: polysaccharide deacetylase family protein [Candidatus Acidiferrales bacterium]